MADMLNYDDEEREERERAAAKPANDLYTGKPCPHCGRIRVYLRVDGQLQCEKCERVWRSAGAEE